ncbi:hypothetical protein LY76DRAFT_174607 [Colletotrichum caudatum]|nr:hypothetical protein LY76DRAFT_174607 [Colletotrichum caudatum]
MESHLTVSTVEWRRRLSPCTVSRLTILGTSSWSRPRNRVEAIRRSRKLHCLVQCCSLLVNPCVPYPLQKPAALLVWCTGKRCVKKQPKKPHVRIKTNQILSCPAQTDTQAIATSATRPQNETLAAPPLFSYSPSHCGSREEAVLYCTVLYCTVPALPCPVLIRSSHISLSR